MDIRMLGPLEVIGDDGAPLPLAGNRQRALLTALALRARMVVPTDTLIAELWGEEPPKTAAVSLQNAVSSVRRSLGADLIVTRAPGYLLDVPRESVDVARFERLLTDARAAPAEARGRMLAAALELWRGPPLAEFAYADFAQAEIRRLQELRLAAIEERIAADIELGRLSSAIPELEALAHQHTLREEPRRLLMLALYRSGRQADALEVYQRTRHELVDELGVEPGQPLRDLHAAILRHEVAPAQAAAVADADVEGEVLRALLAGRLVPVIGFEGPGDIAAQLARAFAIQPDGPLDLARVSQQIATLNGAGPLRDELHARFLEAPATGALERLLADLPQRLRERGLPHQLIVSTRYDRGLETAFAAAGEELDIVSYAADGLEHGRFWHQPPGEAPRRIDVPNTYATELALERRTILLRLRGAVDLDEARAWESFVVTEDDYIDYPGPGDLSGALPVALAAALRRSHLLFLGYELTDWSLRLVRARIFPGAPLAYRSWAITPAPSPLTRALWRRHDIDVVDAEPAAFCGRLRSRLEVT